MNLVELLTALPYVDGASIPRAPVGSVRHDSRLVRPGDVFVAVRGFHVDGHDYIEAAIRSGAIAVIGEDPAIRTTQVPYYRVPDARVALARLAARRCRHPARHLGVIGVTGTDGKTTTCYLIDAVLRAAGFRTGLIGTIEFRIGDQVGDNLTRQTTPEAPELQTMLADMVESGVDWVIMEATSHGLALHRVDECEFDVGVFTNLSGDHLDFHGTEVAYLRDKARLFEAIGDSLDKGKPKGAVLNADEPASFFLAQVTRAPIFTYGYGPKADLRAVDVRTEGLHTSFGLVHGTEESTVRPQLIGSFNVQNCLAAFAVAVALGIPQNIARVAIESVPGVPGRMEIIEEGQPFGVVVDYAHTPDSLQKVLATLRPLTEGRLIVVFGAAGERDHGKRPRLGSVAALGADYAVLTDEDPRSEPSELIIEQIAAGLLSAGRRDGEHYARIPDRRAAIRHALSLARRGDTILLAGKGHESCILMKDSKIDWDDRRVVRDELARLQLTTLDGHRNSAV